MKIEFKSPIFIQNPSNRFERAISDVDTYFALLSPPASQFSLYERQVIEGRTYFVISQSNQNAHPLALRALAIISCFTIIIPFLMLIIKASLRSECRFKAHVSPSPLPKPLPKEAVKTSFNLWQTCKNSLIALLSSENTEATTTLLAKIQDIAQIDSPDAAIKALKQLAKTELPRLQTLIESSPAAQLSTEIINFALKAPFIPGPLMYLEGGNLALKGLKALGVPHVDRLEGAADTPLARKLIEVYKLCASPATFAVDKSLSLLTDMPVVQETLTGIAGTLLVSLQTVFKSFNLIMPALPDLLPALRTAIAASPLPIKNG